MKFAYERWKLIFCLLLGLPFFLATWIFGVWGFILCYLLTGLFMYLIVGIPRIILTWLPEIWFTKEE